MTTLQLVRVHERAEVEQIVADAWEIALIKSPSPEALPETFAKTVDLLAARIPVAPMNTLPPALAEFARGIR